MSLSWGYLAAFALCVGGIVGFVFGMREHQTESMLNAHGMRATGTVRYARARESGSSSSRRGASQQDFFLCVDYAVQGAPTERWFECTMWAMDTHPQGSTVEVIYDPANPSTAMLGGNLNSESSGWTFYGSVIAFLLGVLLALYIKLNYRQLSDEIGDGPDSGPTVPAEQHWTSDPLSEENPGDIPTH
ncbi:MAG: DUF3592 domain-containing protein [Fimbriimonadales bacterium]